LKYIKLVDVVVVQVIGWTKNEHTFSTFSFMKSKLRNRLTTTHLDLMLYMFLQHFFTLKNTSHMIHCHSRMEGTEHALWWGCNFELLLCKVLTKIEAFLDMPQVNLVMMSWNQLFSYIHTFYSVFGFMMVSEIGVMQFEIDFVILLILIELVLFTNFDCGCIFLEAHF